MKKNAFMLVFDGFADWEAALACCEIHKHDRYKIVTVGFTAHLIISMGGLTVVPETTLSNLDASTAAILILPGGTMWERDRNPELLNLLRQFHGAGVPIAAICGATLALAEAGLLDHIRHTSNAKDYLQTLVPQYQGQTHYVDELAVSDEGVITASGAGSVEFAREIITALELYNAADRIAWFNLFKHGNVPLPPS